jgi:hypothetical protein
VVVGDACFWIRPAALLNELFQPKSKGSIDLSADPASATECCWTTLGLASLDAISHRVSTNPSIRKAGLMGLQIALSSQLGTDFRRGSQLTGDVQADWTEMANAASNCVHPDSLCWLGLESVQRSPVLMATQTPSVTATLANYEAGHMVDVGNAILRTLPSSAVHVLICALSSDIRDVLFQNVTPVAREIQIPTNAQLEHQLTLRRIFASAGRPLVSARQRPNWQLTDL